MVIGHQRFSWSRGGRLGSAQVCCAPADFRALGSVGRLLLLAFFSTIFWPHFGHRTGCGRRAFSSPGAWHPLASVSTRRFASRRTGASTNCRSHGILGVMVNGQCEKCTIGGKRSQARGRFGCYAPDHSDAGNLSTAGPASSHAPATHGRTLTIREARYADPSGLDDACEYDRHRPRAELAGASRAPA